MQLQISLCNPVIKFIFKSQIISLQEKSRGRQPVDPELLQPDVPALNSSLSAAAAAGTDSVEGGGPESGGAAGSGPRDTDDEMLIRDSLLEFSNLVNSVEQEREISVFS